MPEGNEATRTAAFLDRAREASCNICGADRAFAEAVARIDPDEDIASAALREGLPCNGCGSISRDRALMLGVGALLQERDAMPAWTPRPDLRVFETSGYRGHPEQLGRLFDYFNTRLLPPEELPAEIDGRQMADLEDLPYPDGFFDLVISADVLEHVGRIESALDELRRVLAEDGQLAITVPYSHALPRTSIRASRWRGRDVHLYPPEYHAEKTLVYRVFGRDLLADLAGRGFTAAVLRGSRGDLAISAQDLIVATKGPYLDLSTLAFGEEANERTIGR
jgi:SAM-dependent methyltransferase